MNNDHAGVFLKEELKARGWSQRKLAYILGHSDAYISDVINGRRRIGFNLAVELGVAFDTSPDLWLNLDRGHRIGGVFLDKEGIKRRLAELKE